MSQKEAQPMGDEDLNSSCMEDICTNDEFSGFASSKDIESGIQDPENSPEMYQCTKVMEESLTITKEVGSMDSTNAEQSFDQDLEKVKPPLINTHPGVSGHRRIGAQKVKCSTQTTVSAITSPMAVSTVVRKRSVVLSNEARKEMAKQARALKDDRRAILDTRHKYLISKIACGIGLMEADVEEALVSDDKFGMIEDFFSVHGPKRLLFYYQVVQYHENIPSCTESLGTNCGQKKLFITTDTTEILNGICLFFLRDTNKAITTSNVSQELNFGMLNCADGNILHSVEKLFTQVMYPALQSQEDWGVMKEGQRHSHVQDFLVSVDKFICSLSTARRNMEHKFQLYNMMSAPDLSHLQEPADYINAGKKLHKKANQKCL